MVVDLAGIALDAGADGLGDDGEIADQLLKREGGEGRAFEKLVEVVGVGGVVLVVVDVEDARLEGRSEIVQSVSEGGGGKGHVGSPVLC